MPPEIPERWKERVRKHIRETHGLDRDALSTYDFPSKQGIYLRFPDGSFALFRHAFCLTDPENNEVAVFTEHCGYHFFPLANLVIERTEAHWVDTA